jgi:hypothetical protein
MFESRCMAGALAMKKSDPNDRSTPTIEIDSTTTANFGRVVRVVRGEDRP